MQPVNHVFKCLLKRVCGFSYLLQPGAEAHVAEVVGEEGARAVGRVPGEQQPAEERDVSAGLHAAVQLHRSAQHQQLERLQQPQLLFSSLKHSLAQLLPLRSGGAVHCCPPLENKSIGVKSLTVFDEHVIIEVIYIL